MVLKTTDSPLLFPISISKKVPTLKVALGVDFNLTISVLPGNAVPPVRCPDCGGRLFTRLVRLHKIRRLYLITYKITTFSSYPS